MVCALLVSLPCLAGEFVVTVRTVTDGTIHGRLVEFSLRKGLVLEPDDAAQLYRVGADDVVEISAQPRRFQAAPASVRLELLEGDRLAGRVAGAGADTVILETATLGTVEVPLGRVRSFQTSAAAFPEHRAAVAALLESRSEEDALLLSNGDVIRGLITGIDRRGFVLETETGEPRLLPPGAVLAATIAPAELPPAKGLRARIITTDGQRLTVDRLEWSGFSAVATALGGVEIHVPGDRIARLEVLGGRWAWLTSLEPISYEHTPALSASWHWARDANVTGGPLRVAGRTFARGLGVHSQCSLTYDLRKEYQEFVTSMGLDDNSGPYAEVDVEIRVDGQLRHQQARIVPGRLYGPVHLDVAGAQRIKLTVLCGANADLQDRFDWVEPALIR